jgi:hypothetical protein
VHQPVIVADERTGVVDRGPAHAFLLAVDAGGVSFQ